MADIKISQLNQATSYTLSDIVAIVDSGNTATKKIKITNILRNNANIAESVVNTNGIAIATSAGSAGFEALRGTNTTSAVVASTDSYIDSGQNAFIGGGQGCSIQTGAAGHNAIAGCDGVSITGGYNHFIGGSYSGPSITGGEENAILASVGGTQVSGNNNAAIATQGFQIGGNSQKACGAGAEAGGWQGPRYSFAGGGYNLTTTSDNGNDHGALAYNGLTFDGSNNGGYLYKVAGIAVQTCSVEHDISVMMAASGRTTQYSNTTHTDNLYSFGRIQTSTTSGTSISNEQFLTGGGGMVQYTTIGAGNLNLKINGVRNGEVYHWVINNDTGGSVSINSVATDTGFGITDNSANSLTTGRHIFTIVIVDDHIVMEGTH